MVAMLAKRLLFTVTIWLPWLAAAQSDKSTGSCDAPPFALQIEDVELTSGSTSWGVLFQIGNPVQRLSLVPSTVTNSTLVNQKWELCNLSNTTLQNQCESIRGGLFNQNDSSTWQSADLRSSNISRLEPTWEHFNPNGPITNIGYDNIRIRGTTHFTLYNAGIALNQRGNQSNAGMIGLGIDSVFLDDVVAQNRSASRSWGLDSGSRSITRGRPGELVIGGYNKGRVDGDWFEFDVSKMEGARSCPLRVSMTEITLISPGGNFEKSLKESAYQIKACIEPYDNRFRWTAEMISNWKKETGFDESLVDPYTAPGQNLAFIEPGLPYDENKTENWQLRITLDGGYSTTITYDEMQRPLQGWNSQGELQTVDGITNVAIFNNATSANEIPTLGKIFLSRSYLRVDYEIGKFYLAPADTNTTPRESILEPMKPPGCKPPTETPTVQPRGDTTPIGAIVGGVVGGVAFAVLFVAFLVWYGKRRRAREERELERQNNPQMGVVPSRRHTNDLEVDWTGSRREERRSTQATNGRLISPRTSGQAAGENGENGYWEGMDLRQLSSASAEVPNSPDDVQRPGELPGDEPVGR